MQTLLRQPTDGVDRSISLDARSTGSSSSTSSTSSRPPTHPPTHLPPWDGTSPAYSNPIRPPQSASSSLTHRLLSPLIHNPHLTILPSALDVAKMNAYLDQFAYEVFNKGGPVLPQPPHHHDPPVGIPEPIDPDLHHPEKITKFGRTVLFVVFGIMTASFIGFTAWSQRVAYRYRTLYVITLLINAIAAISYFAMATGFGDVIIRQSKHSLSANRELLVPRYIDWLFTTPLLLLDLTLLAGLPAGEILVVIVADVIMIVTGLIGALHQDLNYRWGFFAFSLAALFYVYYALVGSARSYAFARSQKVGSLYNQISLALIVVWGLYPVVWAFSEGTGKWTADTEVLAFAVLDVTAKCVWPSIIFVLTPPEGEVLLPESLSTPLGGGYSALSQESREEA
ncbi:unnamed protein product [Parajaminaea phylloscopi]